MISWSTFQFLWSRKQICSKCSTHGNQQLSAPHRSTTCDCDYPWSGTNCELCNGADPLLAPDPLEDCNGITPMVCDLIPDLLSRCPIACDSCVASTTATSTTTTGLCNGAADPEECGHDAPYTLDSCNLNNFVGKKVQNHCPALCGSCIWTTATTTTATTKTTSTPSTTTTSTATTRTATTSTTTITCGVGYGFSAGTPTSVDTCVRCPADAFQTQPSHKDACEPCSCRDGHYDASEPACGTRGLTAKNTFAIAAGSGCTLSNSNMCASSKNYPNNYGNRESCTLTATKGSTINVVGFHTESGYDVLTVNGSSYTGSSVPRLHGLVLSSNTNFSVITWESDGTVTKSGWKICLNAFESNWISTPPICKPCDNANCASNEYRDGICSGATNNFTCKTTTTSTTTSVTTTTTSTTTTTI
eukprot:gene14687-33297_t